MHQVGEYAFNLGLIDYQERTMIEHIILNTTYQERIKDWRGVHDSFDKALDLIVYFAGGVNVYDITKYHDYPTQLLESFFEDTDMITKFKLNAQVEYGAQAGNVYEHLY